MVEVFKTDISTKDEANKLSMKLSTSLPDYQVNFDLQDCDKILRIECSEIDIEKVLRIVSAHGVSCEILEDTVDS